MNIQHVIKINSKVVQISKVNPSNMIIVSGNRSATFYPAKNSLVFHHSVTGKFVSKTVREV